MVSEAATDTERLLAEIMANVMAVPNVASKDNFLQLGGHSLTAMQIVSRVFEEYGVDLDLAMLFDADLTVEDLAAQIDMLRSEQGLVSGEM